MITIRSKIKHLASCWLSLIGHGLRCTFTYSGREGRAEFWGFFLFYEVCILLLRGLGVLGENLSTENWYYLGNASASGASLWNGMMWGVQALLWLSLFSFTVRRLRDAGFSPFWAAFYPAMLLVSFICSQVMPEEDRWYLVLQPEEGPTGLFICVLVSQILATLARLLLLILCLRKSRERGEE